MIKSSKACKKDPVYKQLEPGVRVVVKCDLEAFLPHEDKDDSAANEVFSSAHDRKLLENETIEEFKQDQAANKPKPRYRCRGEGSVGRNTRFNGESANPHVAI